MMTFTRTKKSMNTRLAINISAFAIVLAFQVGTASANDLSLASAPIQMSSFLSSDSLKLDRECFLDNKDGFLRLHSDAVFVQTASWLSFGVTYYYTPKDDQKDSYFYSRNDAPPKSSTPEMGSSFPDGFMVMASLSYDLN